MYLLFSGVHFDAIVFGTFGQRRVQPTHLGAQQSACDLGMSLRTSGKFVDQATMQLVCKECGHEMAGDYEARLHAGSSGHKNFVMKK